MQKTRIQVPVSADTRKALQNYADSTGLSLAGAAGQILEETTGVVWEMANALRMAKTAPAKALVMLRQQMDEQIAGLDQIGLDLTPKATEQKKTG